MAESERVKPRTMFVEEAIQRALDSRWDEALTANQAIVEHYGPDEDAQNRLGKALTELGRHQEALHAYEATLQLNPLNVIAQKNSRKLITLIEAREAPAAPAGAINVEVFAEEPGKSGLTRLTAPSGGVEVSVVAGDSVELVPEADRIGVRTSRGVLLGDVDTKLARRVLPLIATGNRYSGAVARVADDRIELVIRETFQAPENARKSSFPIARAARREEYRPYAKESLLGSRGLSSGIGVVDDDIDEGDDPVSEAVTDDDLDGMQTVDGDFDEAVGAEATDEDEDDDEADIDIRPEDQY